MTWRQVWGLLEVALSIALSAMYRTCSDQHFPLEAGIESQQVKQQSLTFAKSERYRDVTWYQVWDVRKWVIQ